MYYISRLFRYMLLFAGGLALFIQISSAAPAIENISIDVSQPVPQYSKFEASFDVKTEAQNFYFPYDPSPPPGVPAEVGISVEGQFTPDAWATVYTVPAFYSEIFLDEVRSGREWFYPTGRYTWKVRFAPHRPGLWQFRLVARDRSGSYTSPAFPLQVLASNRPGFLRVSRTDARYFEFDNGTYFPALGYNMNFDRISWRNPVLDNIDNLRIMGRNGIQLVRIWLSQWSIFGSEWNPWSSPNPALHGQYLPHTGLTFEHAAAGSEVSMKIDAEYSPCMFIGAWKAAPAVRRNTEYRVRVRLMTLNLKGPRIPGRPYGFVAKTGGWLWGDGAACHEPGSGQAVTPYQSADTGGWQVLEGSLNTGDNDFLPYFYLTLENVAGGAAYIDRVWIEEKLAGGSFGPNIVSKPWMAHHLYFEQRNSYAFDKLLELAEQYGVYFRIVLHEKNDRLLSAFDDSGSPTAPDHNRFYGNYREMTKPRWLMRAFWRYAQARWGYSAQIHSWELLNEGDPWNSRHYALADEFGRFMHCGVFGDVPDPILPGKCSKENPNSHLVTTSFWHSFPREEFWANPAYAHVDYADIHDYIPKTRTDEFSDTAWATIAPSLQFGALRPGGAGKPLIRGETGLVAADGASPSEKVLLDKQGIWLHNMLWASLNSGGMIESYWYADTHIYNSTAAIDQRPAFGRFYRFLQDIPLNCGHYRDIDAQVLNPDLRVVGQTDPVNGRAHLWIQNRTHSWERLVDGFTSVPQSGIVALAGFEPGSAYEVRWYDTYATGEGDHVIASSVVNVSGDGRIELLVRDLVSDVAVKLFRLDSGVTRSSDRRAGHPGGPRRTH